MKPYNPQRGVLLLEVLLAIAFFVTVASLGAQAVLVSRAANRAAGNNDVSKGLLNEMLEAARAGSDGRWQDLYGLTKGTQHYYPQQSSGKWVFTPGDETVTLNGTAYNRYFTVDNVSRDPASSPRPIESTYNPAHDDPSTQKITGSVGWPNGATTTVSIYLSRWRNATCAQTDWSGGASSGVKTCPTTTYDTGDSTVSTTTPGQLKLQ